MTETQDIIRRIENLEHVMAIQALKARYLSACDRQDPDTVRDCLIPENAVVAYEGFPAFNNRDAFVEVFKAMGCQPGIYDMHHGCNSDITLTSDVTATGTWSLFFQNINMANRAIMQMGLEYDDIYKYQDGRWWIAETRTRRTSFQMQTIDQNGSATTVAFGAAPEVFGEAPPAD